MKCIFFSKININLQQFQATPENKTQGNLTNLISMIKKKKQAKLEERYLMDKAIGNF